MTLEIRMRFSGKAGWMLSLVALGTAGCDTMWIQRSTVIVQDQAFPACVGAAVAEVPGVSIDAANSTARNIVLATPLQKGSRGPIAYVTRLQDSNGRSVVEVRFGEWGLRGPEQERARISPLLDAITDGLKRHFRNAD